MARPLMSGEHTTRRALTDPQEELESASGWVDHDPHSPLLQESPAHPKERWWLSSCESTQDVLWSAPLNVDAVATLSQHRGRGRRGRSWVAPKGVCLCLSWRPFLDGLPSDQLASLSFVAAVATWESCAWVLSDTAPSDTAPSDTAPSDTAPIDTAPIDTAPIDSGTSDRSPNHRAPSPLALKWPNDVLYHHKKLSGILCEARSAGGGYDPRDKPQPTSAVVGVGINLIDHPTLPEGSTHLQYSNEIRSCKTLADRLLSDLEGALALLKARGPSAIFDRWKARALPIGTEMSQGHLRGTYLDLSLTGGLILDTPDGPRTIESGEVDLVGEHI
jgi:biotin-(acetyl-CoA carboxylase) ligase